MLSKVNLDFPSDNAAAETSYSSAATKPREGMSAGHEENSETGGRWRRGRGGLMYER